MRVSKLKLVIYYRCTLSDLTKQKLISIHVHTASAPDLTDLMDSLYHTVADKWKFIGIYLHLPMATLNIIATEHQSDPHECLMAMLDAWLNRVEPPPTWSSIIKTMEFLGKEQLAKELGEKYK